MKAIRIREYGDASTLNLEDTPQLPVEHDQVLVKIRDAGVNPIDWKIRAGYLKERMPSAFPLTLGQDFAGEVAELGHGTSGFAPGDRVFGFAQGTYAEYAVAQSSTIAAMPHSMAFDVAASLPTPGSTALQLVRDIGAKTGMRVLIHGAAGSVGSLAVQIAAHLGARVIGTATGPDISYLRILGVEEVIDYKLERFEDKVSEADAVIDLVGGDTLARSYAVIRKGGVLATTVGQINEAVAQRAGIRTVHVMMKRDAADLVELAKLVESGTVKSRLGQTLPLAQAREAQELNEKGKAAGKVVLKVA